MKGPLQKRELSKKGDGMGLRDAVAAAASATDILDIPARPGLVN